MDYALYDLGSGRRDPCVKPIKVLIDIALQF